MTSEIKSHHLTRIKTLPAKSQSSKTLPKISKKLKTLTSQSNYKNLTKIIFNEFPFKINNPETIIKKTDLKSLFQYKRTSYFEKDIISKKAIIPHPVSMNHKFTKESGPKMRQKVLKQQNKVLITAKKWLVYDMQKDQVIKGYKYKKPHDVASLSKLMTFYTSYKIVKQFYLGIDKIDLICQKADSQILGTKINLKSDSIITIEDALYALLLVSANNSATILANNLGHLVKKKKEGKYFSCFDIKEQNRNKNIQYFVKIMNFYCKELLLEETFFENPHGMCKNISNCKSIAILFKQCLKIPLFQKIMLQKQKIIHIKLIQQDGVFVKKPLILENTNSLLWTSKNCYGGKTGTNSAGGDSFVGMYQQKYIFVVLGCCGKQQKFHDCERLYQWVKQSNQGQIQIEIINNQSIQKNQSLKLPHKTKNPDQFKEKSEIKMNQTRLTLTVKGHWK